MRGRKSAAQKIRQKPRHPLRAVATTDDDARLALELASAVLDSHHSRRQQKQQQNRNSSRTRKPSQGQAQPQPLTLRLRGLVALPTALQATAVGVGVFYAFGSALLLCLAVMLTVTSAALRHRQHPPPPSSPPPPSPTPASTGDDDMLDCVSIAHLEHRLQRRTLRLEDCIHYALFKVLHLVETVNTVRRSMLDYNLTLSIAQQQEQQQQQPSAAGHDLLQLVDAVEREKQQLQQLQQQATAASTLFHEHQQEQQQQKQKQQEPAPKPTKKKKPVRKRRAVSVDTVFSSRVTIEEYTVLPERPSLYLQRQPPTTKTPTTTTTASSSNSTKNSSDSDGSKESWIVEAFTADSPVVVADTIATEALTLSETAAVAVDDANGPEEPSRATLEPPISGENDDDTLMSTPKPTKKKKKPRQRATSVEVTSTAALAKTPQLRRRATSVEMPALPVIPEKRPLRRRATSVEVSALKPPITAASDKKLKKKTKPDARVRVESVDENVATQGDTLSAEATTPPQPEPVLAISVSPTPNTTSVSSPEKARRRRNSRRPRQRRSTLSTSERPSAASYVDDIGVVAPAALAKTLVDKNQSLYVAEAAKVRALQEAQPPIETKAISNPEIRIMVDEVNTRVTRMHEALATNWAFLASLSEELLAAEAAAEVTRQEAAAEAAKRKAAALLAADDSDDGFDDADLVDTELRYSELEPEFEDDCYGDVDYDDHYYSYHAMSTPCL